MISDEFRFNSICNVLKELADIAEKVQHTIPEVRALNTFEHVHIIAPRPNGLIQEIRCSDDGEEELTQPEPFSDKWEARYVAVKILPLFAEDALLGEPFSTYASRARLLGGYHQSQHLVILQMKSPETVRFKAHTLLHELQHAFYAMQEGRMLKQNTRSPQERLTEELKIITTDYKIALQIGDRAYRKEATRTAQRIYTNLQKNQLTKLGKKGYLLNALYGLPPCQKCITDRNYLFWAWCTFMAADYYTNPATQEAIKSEAYRIFMVEKPNTLIT